jgi:hypothetical protein
MPQLEVERFMVGQRHARRQLGEPFKAEWHLLRKSSPPGVVFQPAYIFGPHLILRLRIRASFMLALNGTKAASYETKLRDGHHRIHH